MDGLSVWKFKQYQISEVTLQVMDSLIEKRQKEQKVEQNLLRWSLTLFVDVFFMLLYVYLYKLEALETVFLTQKGIPEYVFQDRILFILMIGGIVCTTQLILYKKKHDKAESEYEALRLETIDRGEELWEKPVPWNHRHEVFNWLKKEHDINLYHK